MCAYLPLLWMKPVSAIALILVALLILRKEPKYSLNRLFSLAFLLFSVSQIFDTLKDVLWGLGYPAIVVLRLISVVTGIFATLAYLLTSHYVRYGSYRTFRPLLVSTFFLVGGILSVLAMLGQVIHPVPDPILTTVIEMQLIGVIALFVIPAFFVVIATVVLFQTSREISNRLKRRTAFLLAIGMFVLTPGAIAYGIEGVFSPLDPWRLILSLIGLVMWLLGALLCLLAFYPRKKEVPFAPDG